MIKIQDFAALPLGAKVACLYAVLLSALIVLGFPFALFGGADGAPGNAVHMPLVSLLIALALAGSAYGICQKMPRARFAFLIIAPWGSLALASVFSRTFWQDDIPQTLFLLFAYAPVAFLLTRPDVLESLDVKSRDWLARGVGVLVACAVVMLIARFMVMAGKPTGGGGYAGQLSSLNDYVKRLVITLVPFWHYFWASVLVSAAVFLPGLIRRVTTTQPQPTQMAKENEEEN